MNNPLAEAHQQQQEVAHRSYNPSQAQAYDQSYYGYYQYEQYSDPQHQYSYYSHPDYANAHQQRQEPSSSLHPPGVSIAPATTHMVDSEQTQVQNHPNSYYPQLFVGQQQQQHFVDPGSGALNPGNLGFQQQHWGGNAGGFGPVPVYGGPDAAHRPV